MDPWPLSSASSSPSRSSDSGFPPEELKKRLRSRAYAKKTYDKKKTSIDTLRSELEALEHQYKELLDSRQPSRDPQTPQTPAPCADAHGGDASDDIDDAADASGGALLLQRYKQLTELKQQLYAANEELHRMNTECMIFEARLQQIKDEVGTPPIAEMPLQFRPLPLSEYYKAIYACREEALAFEARPLQRSSGVSVFEWRDRRSVTGDALEFAFEKQFAGVSSLELLEQTWALLANPKTNCKIYSAAMNATSRVLQHVDDSTVLFYWTMRPSGLAVTFKSLYLLSRLVIPGGHMIVFRSVDKDALHWDEDGINTVIEDARETLDRGGNSGGSDCGGADNAPPPARSVFWAKFNNWIVIRESSMDCSKYHFGGSSKASLWEVEVLLMCMRWENLARGKRFLKPSS